MMHTIKLMVSAIGWQGRAMRVQNAHSFQRAWLRKVKMVTQMDVTRNGKLRFVPVPCQRRRRLVDHLQIWKVAAPRTGSRTTSRRIAHTRISGNSKDRWKQTEAISSNHPMISTPSVQMTIGRHSRSNLMIGQDPVSHMWRQLEELARSGAQATAWCVRRVWMTHTSRRNTWTHSCPVNMKPIALSILQAVSVRLERTMDATKNGKLRSVHVPNPVSHRTLRRRAASMTVERCLER